MAIPAYQSSTSVAPEPAAAEEVFRPTKVRTRREDPRDGLRDSLIAAAGRNGIEQLSGAHVLNTSAPDIDLLRADPHRNGFVNAADPHRRVDRGRTVRGQNDSILTSRRKAFAGKHDRVRPRAQFRNHVPAFGVRRRPSHAFDQRCARGLDGDARQRSSRKSVTVPAMVACARAMVGKATA